LTTAHLKVIDMFGQVAETQAPAQYLPATKQQKKHMGAKVGGGVTGGGVGLLLILRLLAYAFVHHASPTYTPVPQQNPGLYMTFTVAVNGTMSVPNPTPCGVSSLDSINYEIQAGGSINGISGYLLVLHIPPYSGPGTYTTSASTHYIALVSPDGSSNWG